MTAKPTLHHQDQTIELGPRHGYRIEGDHVFINAELHVPQGFSAEVALELWASHQPHREGPLEGFKVAQLTLELPTPIGPYIHHVDTRIAAHLPLQGRAYAMVLALVERRLDGQETIHAFSNYAKPQTFPAPHFEGTVGYRVEGEDVELQADGIFNPRPPSNLSGTLSVELWAFPEAESSSTSRSRASSPGTDGVRLAATEVGSLGGQSDLASFERRVAFDQPPAGLHRIALLLCEWTLNDGYVARDRRDFEGIYERSEPVVAPSAPAIAPVGAAAARPVERLRLVPPVGSEPVVVIGPAPAVTAALAPTVAAPPVPAVTAAPVPASAAVATPTKASASGLVSIQTGSVEELAAVKGLNLKLAKEIVKTRPFTSLEDLVRVRGIGEKSLARLKRLLEL